MVLVDLDASTRSGSDFRAWLMTGFLNWPSLAHVSDHRIPAIKENSLQFVNSSHCTCIHAKTVGLLLGFWTSSPQSQTSYSCFCNE